MTTYKEIQQLLKKSEIENLKYELKSSMILKNKDWKDELAKEFVSFANRNGGKVIIGLQNDGNFDGKANYNVDKLKGDINNIMRDKVSPMINYNFEFLECDEGDLSIISIEKKRKIPHAYVVKREGHEIKNRIYYIRTPHGKRFVSNQELSNLFKKKFDYKVINLDEEKFNMKPNLKLIDEYLDLIRNSQLSHNNLISMLNKIHNEFVKFSNKTEISEDEFGTIMDYAKTLNDYILGKDNEIRIIIIGTMRLIALNPKLLHLIKKVNFHNFEKLYKSGYKEHDIGLILYKCGKFESVSTEIYDAIDKKDIDSLKMFERLLYSINIEEDRYHIIRKLRLKIEKLNSSIDLGLIEKIFSIISYLES